MRVTLKIADGAVLFPDDPELFSNLFYDGLQAYADYNGGMDLPPYAPTQPSSRYITKGEFMTRFDVPLLGKIITSTEPVVVGLVTQIDAYDPINLDDQRLIDGLEYLASLPDIGLTQDMIARILA